MRTRHGLAPGSELIIEDAGESIELKPVPEQSGLGEKDGLLVFRGRAVGDIDAAMRDHRIARLRKAGGMHG
jgi:hypothetical protein